MKWSRYSPGVAQSVGKGTALLFHDRGTRREWVVSSTPLPHFTPGKTRYPFYRRPGGPQGRTGRAENLVPTGIRSRTVQPVVSRYTDWATGPTNWQVLPPLWNYLKLNALVAKARLVFLSYATRTHFTPSRIASWSAESLFCFDLEV